MATNFTNKYMQVFQNYNEFGEHSADYVRGEDHIAFLIEENEVIYWLYLEQVWRPLNVRTTTTGQLEDGRTKVAVRLEYIEGGQKYTSVPNIPDPERITSMSHFLEDYPDIEEVNVSGTVNLTDLSYAFAGSKIKDFSMLDTSKVDDMTYCLSNIDNNELEVITYSNVTCCISHILDNSTIKSFIYNGTVTDDSYFDNVTAEKLIVNTEQEITELNRALMRITNGCDISYIKGLNIQLSEAYSVNTLELVEAKEISYDYNGSSYNNFKVKCDSFDLYPRKNNINICNQIDVTEVTILNIFKTAQAKFGKGIKYLDTVNFNIKHNNLNNYIGNFIFTTPIVDDAFYAKYAQYNTPISIFQYKTTFEEVADVNISSKVDSDLLYINTFAVNFNTNELSIEIYNNINILYSNSPTYKNYKKFIIDNTNTASIDNCPMIIGYISYNNNGIIRDLLGASEGHISGYFKSDGSNVNLYHNNLFKNITFIGFEFYNIDSNVIDNSNINFDNSLKCIYLNNNSGFDIDYKNLIKNNKLEVTFVYNYDDKTINRICMLNNYNMNVDVYINYETNLSIYYNLASKESNPLNINADFILSIKVNGTNDSSIINTNLNLENLYVNCTDNGFLIKLFVETKYNNYYQYIKIDNIYGNVNIELPYYDNYASIDYNYKHIDINKTRIANNTSSAMITIFEELDEESTINLITKLIDNADSSSKTIYMYRSQANIIGEENIAAAVAKNYEFAIIEN